MKNYTFFNLQLYTTIYNFMSLGSSDLLYCQQWIELLNFLVRERNSIFFFFFVPVFPSSAPLSCILRYYYPTIVTSHHRKLYKSIVYVIVGIKDLNEIHNKYSTRKYAWMVRFEKRSKVCNDRFARRRTLLPIV